MKKRDYRDYLQDIIDSIDDTESFTENTILISSKYYLGYYEDVYTSPFRTLIYPPRPLPPQQDTT